MIRLPPTALALLLGAVTPLAAQEHPAPASVAADSGGVPLYDDLGDLHHAISTRVPLAQRYFDQGFRLTYAFNHAEALAAYREAARLDPGCAMCWWGVAWALGPNINAAMDSAAGAAAYAAVRESLARIGSATPREAAYVRAMARRYGPAPLADRARLDSAYARAMGDLASRYPRDPDAQVLHAEALMLLSPWNYWTPAGDPRPGTDVLVRRLTGVIAADSNHVGACHFYIHAVESAHPRRALACAERLTRPMPGAGHIVHMPGHIYVRVGRYADAIEANRHAVHVDEAYIADRKPSGIYPQAYYPHNLHFLAFAAEMAGQSRTAVAAAAELVSKVDTAAMRQPGLETLQQYLVAPFRAFVRFGEWGDMLEAGAPPSDLPYARGMWHWGRGMALVRTGDTAAARAELAGVEAAARAPAAGRLLIWNINQASHVLRIGARMLAGELAAAEGRPADAVAQLREGVRLEDSLTYDEPPTWELPVRQYLGAVLLSAGRAPEAEGVYRGDLARFPDNGWSLRGLELALAAQGKVDAAARVRARLRAAWRTADVTLEASRF